jgi:hypothetical protein
MKKKILFILPALIGILLMGCEPQRDDFKMEGFMNPSDIKLSAEGRSQAGSNGVVLHVADGVMGGWFYDGKAIGAGDGVYTILRSEGSHEFTFLQTSNEGLVEVKTSYTVTVMDVELPPLEVTVWDGSATVDGGAQPQFTAATGADWSAAEAGNTLRFEIDNRGVGWGQFYPANWAYMMFDIPGGYPDKFVEYTLTQKDIDAINTAGGMLVQGAGWSVTKIIIIK